MKFLRSIFGENDEAGTATGTIDAGPDPVLAALAELEVKRLRQALAAAAPAPEPEPEVAPEVQVARPSRVVKAKAPLPDGVAPAARSIWDLEDETPKPAAPMTGEGSVGAAPRRATRTKTRVLGFEAQPAEVVPLFEGAENLPVAATPAGGKGYVMFPAGWLIVKNGPGKGASFALSQGVSQIGRGTDQTVSLDYGDMAISRQNHAAIAYDAQTHEFHIGHGGKSNLVRMNGRPLLSTEAARDGDEIQIGETTLILKVLCTPAFNWSSYEAEGDGHDMAIA